MMLFIGAVVKDVYCSNISYWVNDYEAAFERLTQLVADGWVLEDAFVVDEGDCTALPVDAFDGQPIEGHVLALQRRWNQLLTETYQPKSVPTPPDLE